MQELFECPDCNRTHCEPAAANLGLRVRCLECELARSLTEPFEPRGLPVAA